MSPEWFRVNCGFNQNAKISALSDRAYRLYFGSVDFSASNLLDGRITKRNAGVIAAIANTTASRRWTRELEDGGLWRPHESGDGWVINDYHDYQPSAEYMKDLAKKRSAAGRLGGLASGEARREASAKANAEASASPNRAANPKQNVKHNTEQDATSLAALAPLSETQSPPSYVGGRDFSTLGKLKGACHADTDAGVKLERAARGCTEADIIAALEACRGPGVRDRLAVALSELKKRREAVA